MLSPAMLLRDARRHAGLTQAALAGRLGVSQVAVAKLEREDANPTVATLSDALRCAGQRLVLTVEPLGSGIDPTLIAEQLRLSPEQRISQLEGMYEWGRELSLAGDRHRGALD